MPKQTFTKNLQYAKFCAYGFLKDLRFYEPFMLLVFLDKGLSYLQIGTLYATREVLINITEVPSGIFADSVGRRMTMVFSFLAYILAFLTFYVADRFEILLLAMVAYAFGDAFRTGTHKAMIFDYLRFNGWEDQKTYYYGHTRAWSQRGAALSAIIAALLVLYQGSYAPIFLFTIIPYVLNLFLILSYPKNLDGKRHTSDKRIRDEFMDVLRSLVTTLKSFSMLRTISSQALYSGYYKAFKDYLQPLLQTLALSLPLFLALEDQKRTALVIGIVYSILYATTAFASSKSGAFASHFNGLAKPLNITLLVGLSLGLVSGLLLHLSYVVLAVVLYLGIYILENLRKPMGIAYVSERMDQTSLASGLSVESQAESLFAAGIALLLGWLSSLFGVGMGILLVSLLCLLLGLVLQLPLESATASQAHRKP
ncbi:MFS transporter [Sphaerochaeta globosa]|jgi:MFS family permease|uniref:Major facilitator superfamily MFS_1 n=1 Tax=Sphaerochaeta globosa (strain ATCC BAA-1886 / DSM 22777 / Buddy) TaxID=158189 RepID=F0RUV9_SPHGB|nr:MFS transporter [Sphaerochaeta globosa]ADY12537.1 major facilitator superfamily MFS_1 [Sphaerochaeta globosa str. Buddy]